MSNNEVFPLNTIFTSQEGTCACTDPDSHYYLRQNDDAVSDASSLQPNLLHGQVETACNHENITIVANTTTTVTVLRLEVLDDGFVYVKTQPLSSASESSDSEAACVSSSTVTVSAKDVMDKQGATACVSSSDSEPLQFLMDSQSFVSERDLANKGQAGVSAYSSLAHVPLIAANTAAVTSTAPLLRLPSAESNKQEASFFVDDKEAKPNKDLSERPLFHFATTVPILRTLKRKHVADRIIEQVNPKRIDVCLGQMLVPGISHSVYLHPRGCDNDYNTFSTLEVNIMFDPNAWESLLYWCRCTVKVSVRIYEGHPRDNPVIFLGSELPAQREMSLTIEERKGLAANIFVNKVMELQKIWLSTTCREDIYFEITIGLSIEEMPCSFDDDETVIVKTLSR